MAIKPPELLNRIPSVSELLEKPPIRGLVNHWSQSAVAGSVRTFLEEVRSDLQRRTAELPSIRELAERAARYVISQQQQSLGVAINATGVVCGSPWSNAPLSDSALERIVAVGREFSVLSSTSGKSAGAVELLLSRISGAQAAAAVHSYPTALWLALSTIASDREVLIARTQGTASLLAEPLSELAVVARAHLKEVGAAERTLATDYEAVVSPRTAAILKIGPDQSLPSGETSQVELGELVALARDRELVLIEALGVAPIATPPESFSWPLPSARVSLAAGVDLVVLEGNGLAGGPSCGILLGGQNIIRRITEHPVFVASQIDCFREAALKETLQCYDGSPRGLEAIPVWQCLNAPIANLRNRAERLAPQLAQMAGVSSADAIETRSPILASVHAENSMPSYGVSLTPADGDVLALDARLRSATTPIRGRVENGRLVLDLRTVFPRQDRLLVESLVGTSTGSDAG